MEKKSFRYALWALFLLLVLLAWTDGETKTLPNQFPRQEKKQVAVLAWYYQDVARIVVPKDIRCSVPVENGKPVKGQLECTGNLKVIFKTGTGRYEVERR